MVLLAGEDQLVLPDRDDGGDVADLQIRGDQRVALLDMRLEETLVPPFLVAHARFTCEPDLLQRLAQRLAVIAVGGGVDLALFKDAEEGFRAEERTVMALLVTQGNDIDAAIGEAAVIGNGASGFQPVDHAERTVEPAGMVLALQMRPGKEFRPRRLAPPEDRADPVYARIEPGLAHAAGKPVPRLHVLR